MTAPAPSLLPYRFVRAGRHNLVQFVDPHRLDWNAGFFHLALPGERPCDAIMPFDRFIADRPHEPCRALRHTAGVFHVSRCGSTLLGQNIKATGRAVVLSEPPFFRILRTRLDETVAADAAMRAVLEVVSLWETWSCAQGRSLVIKFNSQMHHDRAAIMTAMRETRFLFLHREPLPVFESLLRETPQYLRRPEQPGRGARAPASAMGAGDPVLEAAAMHYLTALEAFTGVRERRLRMVRYDGLAERFAEILEHLFGEPAPAATWDAVTNAKPHRPGAPQRYRAVSAERLAEFAREHAAVVSLADARYRRFLRQLDVYDPASAAPKDNRG